MPETLFRGAILTLERLDERWEVVRHAPGAAVLVLEGNRVLGVRQHRPAIGMSSWEVPAGLIDAGETPRQAALRELAEEAQLTGRLELLAQGYPSPGFTDEIIYLFRATELAPAFGELDEGEEVMIEWRDAGEAWSDAIDGRLATSLVTLLALRHALAELGTELPTSS